jgi:hypothetical protein
LVPDNSDGYVDIQLKPKKRIVIVPYDVQFPILAKPPSPAFELLSASGGAYTLVINPSKSVLASTVWLPSKYALSFGDSVGTGSVSMVVQALTAGQPNFLISTSAANGQPLLLQPLTSSSVGVEISGQSTLVTLQDTNRDGRADLIVWASGKISTVVYAATDGMFAAPAASLGGPALAAWRSFCSALTLGDAASANGLLSSSGQLNYGGALTALGQTTIMRGVSANWSEPQPVFVTPDIAELFVVQLESGQNNTHLVDLIVENGKWVVESF